MLEDYPLWTWPPVLHRWLCCLRNGYNFYHQYAQLDFTVLDKRLGTVDELRHLVADAHELGIYVIVDVVQS